MNTKNLQNAYEQSRQALQDIDRKKQRTVFWQKIMWTVMGLYLLFLLVFLASYYASYLNMSIPEPLQSVQDLFRQPNAMLFVVGGFMVLVSINGYYFTRSFQKFKTAEQQVMAKMVHDLFPQVEFSQGLQAPKQHIVQSKLFAWLKKDSPMYSFGQLRTRTNEVQVNIADVGLVEKNVSNTFLAVLMRIPILNMLGVFYQYIIKNLVSKHSAENQGLSFRGMFCWLTFKKRLQGHTLVLPNNSLTQINRMSPLHFKEEQKIQLEDPRFNREFLVYSTDQVEARYVLSLALMERIVRLKEKFNQPILLSFQHQQLFLAVQNEEGLFSFPSGTLSHLDVVTQLAHDIETALQIATELKLKPV